MAKIHNCIKPNCTGVTQSRTRICVNCRLKGSTTNFAQLPQHREMTLDEWCHQLPPEHLVNKQLWELKNKLYELQRAMNDKSASDKDHSR